MTESAILEYATRLEAMRTESFTDHSGMAYFFAPPTYEQKLLDLVDASDAAIDSLDPRTMSSRDGRAFRLIAVSNLRQANRALLAAEPPPEDVFEEAIRDLIRHDEESAWAANDIRLAISGQDDEADGAPSDVDDFGKSVQGLVDRILKAAGGSMTDLVSAVSWTAVGANIGGKIGGIVSRAPELQEFVTEASRFASYVRDKALRLLGKAVEAIQKIIGSDSLNEIVKNVKQKLETWGKNQPGGVSGYILGQLSDARSVATICAKEASDYNG